MRIIKALFIGVIFVVALFFTAINTHFVKVYYYYDSPPLEIPLFLVALGAILLGMAISGLIAFVERLQLKREIRSLKRVVKEQEAELNALRNLPLEAEKEG